MPYRRTVQIQARIDDQRAALVRSATDLLAGGGYAACSVAAVADRAGVASGTVYRHFASKADLVAELFRTVVTGEVDAVCRAAAGSGHVSARAAAVVRTFAGRALKAPRLAYALLAEPVDPVVDGLRLEFRTAFRDVIAGLVREGVAAGDLPPQDGGLVAAALVGAIGEALVGPLSGGHDDTHTVNALTEFVLRGLGVVDVAHA